MKLHFLSFFLYTFAIITLLYFSTGSFASLNVSAKETQCLTLTSHISCTGKTTSKQNTKKKKTSCLPYASFRVKKDLNPWNFTITLRCSRILLKKEVSKTTLTLKSTKKNTSVFTAVFTKLSKNGRNITYTIKPSKQHLLCPGNSSKNGNYFISSSFFSQKLTTKYTERISKNTLSGFVLRNNGKPIKNALVRIKTTSGSVKCRTNQSGYYRLKKIKHPISLTVKKDGFQKETITSLQTSSKGIICENIILKPNTATAYSLDFFVTDTDGCPLPDATVQIFPADKKISSVEIPETTACQETFSDKDCLLEAKTNSSGKLSCSNMSASKKVSCTNLTLNGNLQVSHYSSYTPNRKNIIQTGSKLNIKDNYIIYISCNPLQNDTSQSYHTARLFFSFSSLPANHALITVKLKTSPIISTSNLSILLDTPSFYSDMESLEISFYHNSQQKAFLKTSVTCRISENQDSTLLLPALSDISLPDDRYFIRLCAKTKENTVLGISSLETVFLKNGIFSKHTISIQQSCFSRILTYYESILSDAIPTAAFYLYQAYDNQYFLIDTITTTFTKHSYSMMTANLILSGLLKEQQYLLCPTKDGTLAGEKNFYMQTDTSHLTTSLEDALTLTPLLSIRCILSEQAAISTEYSKNTRSVTWQQSYNFNQNVLRSSSSYPNTVLAFYRKDGALLSFSLVISGNLSAAQNRPNNTILDIYTNQKILITSQASY